MKSPTLEVVAITAQVDAMAELMGCGDVGGDVVGTLVGRWWLHRLEGCGDVDGTMNEQEGAVGVSAWVGPQPWGRQSQ